MGGSRRGYAKGPDDRPLRMVERVIDTGDQGIYLVQVAATTEEIDAQMRQFELDLTITFAILALVLVGSSALQLRYGLQPLRRLQEGVIGDPARRHGPKIDGVFPPRHRAARRRAQLDDRRPTATSSNAPAPRSAISRTP